MSRCFACSCPIPYPLKEYQDIKIPDRLYCILCWMSIVQAIIEQNPDKIFEYISDPDEHLFEESFNPKENLGLELIY